MQMSRQFYNVAPDQVSNVNKYYKSHEKSCIFCGSETEDISDLEHPYRFRCVDCEARLTLINDNFVEFYITPEQENQIDEDLGSPM